MIIWAFHKVSDRLKRRAHSSFGKEEDSSSGYKHTNGIPSFLFDLNIPLSEYKAKVCARDQCSPTDYLRVINTLLSHAVLRLE